jgi:hypothetical protein
MMMSLVSGHVKLEDNSQTSAGIWVYFSTSGLTIPEFTHMLILLCCLVQFPQNAHLSRCDICQIFLAMMIRLGLCFGETTPKEDESYSCRYFQLRHLHIVGTQNSYSQLCAL